MLSRQVTTILVGNLALAVCSVALAQPQLGKSDQAIADLASARKRYEKYVTERSNEVLAACDKAENALRSKNATWEEIEGVTKQREAFQSTGAWPASVNVASQLKRFIDHREYMVKNYETAIRESKKAMADSIAKILEAERDAFQNESDITPWRPLLSPKPDKPDSAAADSFVVGTDKKTIPFGEFATGAYKLELKAKRSEGGEGPLHLRFPLPDGRQGSAQALPDGEKEYHVVLSIRDSLVSADLGIIRPLSIPPAEESENSNPSRDLVLWTDAGAVSVESVSIKPLRSATEAELEAKITPRPARDDSGPLVRKVVDPAAELTEGSVWKGEFDGEPDQTLKVLSRSDNEVVVSVTRPRAPGTFMFCFGIKGDQLTLKWMRGGAASEDVTFAGESGAGQIKGRQLRWTYSCRANFGHNGSRPRNGAASFIRE
ncbi:MAG: hypothetical protein FLDDKLPJ_02690 [Phycisphaerae bacterium]|nr:hypothetical protein [Phycisphaerae bacterium]